MPRGIPGSGPNAANVHIKSGALHTDDTDIVQNKPRVLRSTGDAADALDPLEIEPVDRMPNQDLLDELKFNEELVEVSVAESHDPEEPALVQTWCNGVSQFFERGTVQTVKRKFVVQLARAKRTVYKQVEYVDANGAKAFKQVPHTSMAYPFSIVRDSNPRGAEWARQLYAAPA